MNIRIYSNRLLPIALILLVGIICYSNTLSGPFLFDDTPNITGRKGLHFDSFSSNRLNKLGQIIRKKGRPVVQISLALNYYFGNLNTFGYHLVNLFIHLTATLARTATPLNIPNEPHYHLKEARAICA